MLQNYLSPVAVGSSGTLSNSQCSLNPASSSVTTSGNDLTLNMPVTFTSTYQGARNVYLSANNGSGQNSGWQTLGTWNVTPIAVSSVTPASGSGAGADV